jgi:hypothetical protein
MAELRQANVPQPKRQQDNQLVTVPSQSLELVPEDDVTGCHSVSSRRIS